MWTAEHQLDRIGWTSLLTPAVRDAYPGLKPPSELLRAKHEENTFVVLAGDGFVYKLFDLTNEEALLGFSHEREVYMDDSFAPFRLEAVNTSVEGTVGVLQLPYTPNRSVCSMTPQGCPIIRGTKSGSPDALMMQTIPSKYVEQARRLVQGFHKAGRIVGDVHGGNYVLYNDTLKLIDFTESRPHRGKEEVFKIDKLKFLHATGQPLYRDGRLLRNPHIEKTSLENSIR